MRVKIDGGTVSHLPICACGWRGLPALSHDEALHEARHHENRAHPGDDDVRRAIASHARRHAGIIL